MTRAQIKPQALSFWNAFERVGPLHGHPKDGSQPNMNFKMRLQNHQAQRSFLHRNTEIIISHFGQSFQRPGPWALTYKQCTTLLTGKDQTWSRRAWEREAWYRLQMTGRDDDGRCSDLIRWAVTAPPRPQKHGSDDSPPHVQTPPMIDKKAGQRGSRWPPVFWMTFVFNLWLGSWLIWFELLLYFTSHTDEY